MAGRRSAGALRRGLSRLSDIRDALRYVAHPPHFVVVLGMHRSGTSLMSRTLHLMGAGMGPVEQEQPMIEGEVHWEGFTLTWVNDQILARTGGSWHTPVLPIATTRRDLWRCRRFLWQFGNPVSTFKDPRLCLTFPLWRRVLPRHTIVACHRHPYNVAESLSRRDGIPIEAGLTLWRTYNEALLRIVEQHDEVFWFNFDEGASSLGKVVHGLSSAGRLVATEQALSAYRSSNHHHRSNGTLPHEVASLHETLCRASSD